MSCHCPDGSSCDPRSHAAYLTMEQLKQACYRLGLRTGGRKPDLIERVVSKLTGNEEQTDEDSLSYPSFDNLAHPTRPAPDALILPKSYRCNLETRQFFKKLIGEHFAFTAVGHRWIRKCWREGKPPTYREFANFWTKERSERRKKKPVVLEQFAYNRFIQSYIPETPGCTHEQVSAAWRAKQEREAAYVFKLIEQHRETKSSYEPTP